MAKIRLFGKLDGDRLLAAIGECRKACINARSLAPINGDVYQAAGDVNKAIDALAGVLTGDPEHFHTKTAPSGISY